MYKIHSKLVFFKKILKKLTKTKLNTLKKKKSPRSARDCTVHF